MPMPGFPAALVTLVLLASACGGGDDPTGPALFGLPDEMTGLDSSTCRPELTTADGGLFVPPEYGPGAIGDLRSRTLIDPPPFLPFDPYLDSSLVPAATGGVCAVIPEPAVPGGYRLGTFADASSAAAGGGVVTHAGACGACSSLQDLAVYLAMPNLGEPVRRCALLGRGGDDAATFDCLLDLGFSEPCAQIWAFNSANTRAACLGVCLAALGDPNHLPDGTLNPCLACDEEESGPVFKAVAGRTRRNSGIPSAICRPPGEVAVVLHDAYP
jgi:hypothetical protein